MYATDCKHGTGTGDAGVPRKCADAPAALSAMRRDWYATCRLWLSDRAGWPDALAERSMRGSGDDVVDHGTGHVGEAEIAAAVAIGQLRVIDAEQVEDRRVEIVNVHRLVDRLEAEVVGGAVTHPPLDPAPAQPHREAERVVIPPVLGLPRAAADFHHRRPSELGPAHDERVLEEAARFQVLDHRRERLV